MNNRPTEPPRQEGERPMRPILITADWVAPMDRPLVRDGAVAIEQGRVRAVGPAAELRRQFADAAVDDLDRALLLPALVNAHTHLELSGPPPEMAAPDGTTPGQRFVEWLKLIIARGQLPADELATTVEQAVRRGVRQCLRFGVGLVGDVSRHCLITRPLLARGPLRIVSFGEVQGMGRRRGLLEQRLAAALDAAHAGGRLRIGLTPHAPYSVEMEGFRRCVELARLHNLPLTTHLAETADEDEFLAHHRGPFMELWQWLGFFDENVPRFAGGPIRMARAVGLLDYPTLLAHVNYCDDVELDLLAAGSASVVFCPRTHAYFGHGPHRWRRMLQHGVNVAVGTDSRASSPDLNVVAELRLLRRIDPTAAPALLWELVSTRAARSLGMQAEAGSITPGKPADLVAFPATSPDPLGEVLDRDVLPLRLWLDGRVVEP